MKDTAFGSFYSGTSGLVLPVPNKASFPLEFRDKSRLTYYASLFNSIEINSSFYKVPKGITVKRWADSVPETFRFTFKLYKEITHAKGFNFDPDAINSFLEIINHAGYKKGCLLIQLPPSVTISSKSRLEKIFNRIHDLSDASSWKTAIEFRHASWYNEEIYLLSDQYKMSVVLHDMPSSYNMRFHESASFVYLRFHGPIGDYKGGYPDAFLKEYASMIDQWLTLGKDVYVYFNNTIGDAVKNVLTLQQMVRLHQNL